MKKAPCIRELNPDTFDECYCPRCCEAAKSASRALLLAVGFIVAVILLAFTFSCGGVRPPKPPDPPPPVFDVKLATDTCLAIWREQCNPDVPAPANVVNQCVENFRVGVLLEDNRQRVANTDECKASKVTPARKGIVRASGAVLLDDEGPRPYLGGSLFWALWGYEHDRARLVENLKFLKSINTDYVRVILSAKWGIVDPNPTKPNWEANIAGMVDLIYSMGMRTELTIFGYDDPTPTPASRKRAVEAVARVANARPHKVFLIEVVNEAYTNFPESTISEIRDLARYLQANTKNLVAVTAPRTDGCEEQKKWYGGNVGTVVTLHFSRSFTGGQWRPVRQPWRESRFSCDTVARAYVDNERIGPQSSVNSDSDPMRLAAGHGVSWVAGMGAVTLHTGAGISGQKDPARNRPANVYETVGIKEIATAINNTRNSIQVDVAGFAKDASRPSRVFTLSSSDWDKIDAGRFYCAYKGIDFTCEVFAITGPLNPVAEKAMRVRVIHQTTGAQLKDITLAKGQKLPIAGTPAAVIIRGTLK